MTRIINIRLERIADVLLILWGIISLIVWFSNKSNIADIELLNRLLVVGVYFLFRLILTNYLQRASLVVLAIVVLLYLYELTIGFLQIFGIMPTNDQYNLIVGTFNNPGPYGCFIATCVVLFIVYYFQNKNTKISIVFIIASIIGVILLPSIRSRSAILSLLVALFIFFYKNYKAKVKRYLPFIIVVLFIVGAAAYYYKKPSAQGRFFMSKISVKALFTNKLIGNGLGSFEGTYGNQQYYYFSNKMNHSLDYSLINETERLVADCPSESFNDYLRIGIESGLISMIIYLTVIGCAIFIALKTKCIWSYGLITYSVFALFSFPSRLLLFNILFPMLLSLCVSCKKDNEYVKYNLFLLFIFISSLFMVISLYPSKLDFTKSKTTWTKKTNKQYLMGKYDRVIEGSDTLINSLYSFPPFLFAYGRTLHLQGDYAKSDSLLWMGSQISSDPMFWNVMGNNSLALGRYREAEERYKHAFYMVPNRLYPLYLLAKLYHAEGDTVRFLDMADKVETFIPKIESVNTELLRSEIREIKAGYEGTIKQENEP